MEKYVLAIDQGTTSTRAIVFDSDQKVVKVAQKEITNFFPKPGWVEQDANEIWLSTLAVMAQIFDGGQIKPEQIVSIGISNQRETSVVWDKETGDNSYADCELAWTSLPGAVRKFRYKWHGMIQENMANKEERIHPTQKPVSLYGWLIGKYAPVGGGNFRPYDGLTEFTHSCLQNGLRLCWLRDQ